MKSRPALHHSSSRNVSSFFALATVVLILTTGVTPGMAQSNSNPADSWVRAGDRGQQRIEHQAVTLKHGKVLVMGGYDVEALDILFGNGQGRALDSAEIYDPESDTWSPAARMPQPAGFQWAAVLKNGQVLIAGNLNPITGNAGTFSAIYDPEDDRWFQTDPLPIGVANPHAYMRAVVLKDGRVLITENDLGLIFTPNRSNAANGTWDYTRSRVTGAVTRLHKARVTAALARLKDGRVLHLGGIEHADPSSPLGPEQSSAAADLFDPATGEWIALPDMPAIPGERGDDINTVNPGGRWAPIAETLPDGRVLVAGGLAFGTDGTNFFIGRRSSALLFDPQKLNNPWTIITPMIHRRWFSRSATLDEEGRVLVAGGGFDPTTSEIFDPESGAWSPAASFPSIDAFGSQLNRTGEELLLTGGYDYEISPPSGVPQLGSVKSFVSVQGDPSEADGSEKKPESRDEFQELVRRARKLTVRRK